MKNLQALKAFLLMTIANIYCTAFAQDTLHAVNDPEMKQYYRSHWFWIITGIVAITLLLYSMRKLNNKQMMKTAEDPGK